MATKKEVVGFKFNHPKLGKLVVTEHILTEHGGLSTFMRCRGEGPDPITLHENVIYSAMAGESLEEPLPPVRAKKEGVSASKLEKAKRIVADLEKDSSLSNTQRIKQLADKLRITRTSASAYFYKVRAR